MKMFLKRFDFRHDVSEDDRRLVIAGIPMFFLLAFASGFFLNNFRLLSLENFISHSRRQLEAASPDKIYPVLVKQIEELQPTPKDEIRALSDITAAGTGGITIRYGFHTLTSDDTLALGDTSKHKRLSGIRKKRTKTSSSSDVSEQDSEILSPSHNASKALWKQNSQKKDSQRENSQRENSQNGSYRIPTNYRFQKDFELRFDGSSLLSLARQKLAGFSYFQNLLRQIEANFSSPGINYISRDQAGYIINQPIKPQVVKVLFALDSKGNVTDVRKVYSIGQTLVDKACLNTLRNKNFGQPPAEIFKKGNVFGIRFVFPHLLPP